MVIKDGRTKWRESDGNNILSMAINMMSTELGGIICNKDDIQVRTVLRSCTLKPRASQYHPSPKYPEQMSSICAFVFSYTL